jgi:hypothetical protein
MALASQGLRDYEDWLDALDKKLRIADDHVLVEFDHPLTIPLNECQTIDAIKQWAGVLRETLHKNHSHLPYKYLIERFLRFALIHHKLPVSQESLAEDLKNTWGDF